MNLLIGAVTIGLLLSLLALGVYISFRIFNFADITVDGSITLGAAVAAILLAYTISETLVTFKTFATDPGSMRIDRWIVWALLLSPRPSLPHRRAWLR